MASAPTPNNDERRTEGLREQGEPADHNGMNVITWRQGRTGKGWIFPDGHIRAWSVNSREQRPHAEVEHPEGSVRFRISPDGDVEVHGGEPWQVEAAERAVRESMTSD